MVKVDYFRISKSFHNHGIVRTCVPHLKSKPCSGLVDDNHRKVRFDLLLRYVE